MVTPTDVQLSGPDDQGDSSASMAAIANVGAPAAAGASEAETAALADAPDVVEETVQASARRTPVVKSEMEKTPRNAPCPCGSGKKYKQCHGR